MHKTRLRYFNVQILLLGLMTISTQVHADFSNSYNDSVIQKRLSIIFLENSADRFLKSEDDKLEIPFKEEIRKEFRKTGETKFLKILSCASKDGSFYFHCAVALCNERVVYTLWAYDQILSIEDILEINASPLDQLPENDQTSDSLRSLFNTQCASQ